MMLFQIGGRLYHPPSLLSEGFKARMCIASFTPLSNHLCSTSSIFVFSKIMVWSGLSVCVLRPLMWWNSVSYVLQIWPSWAFGFPNICGSHSSQLILCTGPTTLSFPTGSFGLTVGAECSWAWNTLVYHIPQKFSVALLRSPWWSPVSSYPPSSLQLLLLSFPLPLSSPWSLPLSPPATSQGSRYIPVPLSHVPILYFFLLGHSQWISPCG